MGHGVCVDSVDGHHEVTLAELRLGGLAPRCDLRGWQMGGEQTKGGPEDGPVSRRSHLESSSRGLPFPLSFTMGSTHCSPSLMPPLGTHSPISGVTSYTPSQNLAEFCFREIFPFNPTHQLGISRNTEVFWFHREFQNALTHRIFVGGDNFCWDRIMLGSSLPWIVYLTLFMFHFFFAPSNELMSSVLKTFLCNI